VIDPKVPPFDSLRLLREQDLPSATAAQRPAEADPKRRGVGLPGGVAVSRLRVYDWPTPDGLRGGSPHLHTASTEGYVVLAGHGRVQTLSARGLEVTDLAPGTVAWFTPGTVHRLINDDDALEILTLMSNAGLPEAGDAVLTFPQRILNDPAEYERHATLPVHGTCEAIAAAARLRRDLAMEGFTELAERARADLDDALDVLYSSAAALVATRASAWRDIVDSGPLAQTRDTLHQLSELVEGRPGAMFHSGIHSATPREGERYGMCGLLTSWDISSQ